MTYCPGELHYSRTHEWVKLLDDGSLLVGLTDFAQEQLGDVLFVDLPEAGEAVGAGQPLCEVESVAAVFSVNSPVSGVVAEVNESLLDVPEQLNENPYGAWIVRLSQTQPPAGLMDAAAYAAFVRKDS